ncbi:MAG: glycosyltransferase family 4 protein [Actinomycetota bacterium]|nr:glycosyltransferase family 4 protein [Actinomycetota bacterium]
MRSALDTVTNGEPAGGRRPRGLFIAEDSLGNRTVYENMKAAAIGSRTDVEVVSDAARGIYRRLPFPKSIRSTLTLRRDVVRFVDRSRPDYVVTNTHKPVVLAHDLVSRVPTAIMLDATPIQFDALGYLDDRTDRIPGFPALKYRLVRALFHRAAALLPFSSWAGRSLVEDYGVPEDRVFVTPPGVDTEAWHPGATQARDLQELLFIGGDFERKGGPELLDWFRKAGRERARLTLVTRAPVPEEPGIRVVQAASNSPELRELVRSADIFVLPTRADCFSHATCEAMASGVPAVVTDVGGIADLVDDGVTGYLIPPLDAAALANALDALLSSESLRRRMGAAARERAVAMFDSRRAFERVTAIGASIADARPRGRRAGDE